MDRAEIERSLTGAWRLFLDKPDALRFFDVTADGFWRSFRAIILVAPFYAVTALADRHDILSDSVPDDAFSDTAFWFGKAVTLCLDWVTLPILLGVLAGFIGLRRGYPAYIVARNWATVLMIVPFAAIGLLDYFDMMSPELLFLPSVAALAVVLRMSYLIARRTLQVGVDVAIGLVALDFLVSLAIVMIVSRVFGMDGGS